MGTIALSIRGQIRLAGITDPIAPLGIAAVSPRDAATEADAFSVSDGNRPTISYARRGRLESTTPFSTYAPGANATEKCVPTATNRISCLATCLLAALALQTIPNAPEACTKCTRELPPMYQDKQSRSLYYRTYNVLSPSAISAAGSPREAQDY